MPNSLISSMLFDFEIKTKEKEKEIEPKPLIDWLKAKTGSEPLADVVVDVAASASGVVVAYGRPACPHCESSWIVEHADVKGGVYLRCWSCRVAIKPDAVLLPQRSPGDARRLLPWG